MGMKECECDAEEDNFCYLCCGNDHQQCLPAHQHNILRLVSMSLTRTLLLASQALP